MSKVKTHYEQVPLEVVTKNIEEELRLQNASQTAQGSGVNRFDIFQIESGGSVRWLETVDSLEEVKARVQELGLLSPREYIILDQQTGNKLVITAPGASDAPAWSLSRLRIWEQLYQQARGEIDPQKLMCRISAAENAIFQRLQELDGLPGRKSETMAILDALEALFAIKDEKLNWQRLFHNLLLEHRPQELFSKIQATEAAIYRRLQEMAHDTSDQLEREAIADAISNLRTLQRERMSVPDGIDFERMHQAEQDSDQLE
jgi:hemerythrin superfamily protein